MQWAHSTNIKTLKQHIIINIHNVRKNLLKLCNYNCSVEFTEIL